MSPDSEGVSLSPERFALRLLEELRFSLSPELAEFRLPEEIYSSLSPSANESVATLDSGTATSGPPNGEAYAAGSASVG